MSHALPEMLTLLEQHPATLRKLQHLLFGPRTEQTDRVCPPCSPTTAIEVSKPRDTGGSRPRTTQEHIGCMYPIPT
jgi:transposase-like protein